MAEVHTAANTTAQPRSKDMSATTHGNVSHIPRTNGSGGEGGLSEEVSEDPEQIALGEKYSSQLVVLKELFSDWTQDDLIFALSESDGDLDRTISRISEGHASKWGEVKQPAQQQHHNKSTTEKIKQKVSEIADKITGGSAEQTPRQRTTSARGGRGSRPSGRGGSARGAAAAATAVNRETREKKQTATPTTTTTDAGPLADSWAEQTPTSWGDSELPATTTTTTTTKGKQQKAAPKSSWGPKKQQQQPSTEGSWSAPPREKLSTDWGGKQRQNSEGKSKNATTAQLTSTGVIPSGTKSSWASIVKPVVAPPPPQQQQQPPSTSVFPDAMAGQYDAAGPAKTDSLAAAAASSQSTTSRRTKPSVRLPNAADKRVPLTEGNLEAFEQTLPSTDKRRPSQSAAATEATNRDSARSALLESQPTFEKQPSVLGGRQQPHQQQQSQQQPYQRRFNHQHQDGPVIMPESNNTPAVTSGVDRASVQFGSLNLNGAQSDEQIYQGESSYKASEVPQQPQTMSDLGRQTSDQHANQQQQQQQQQQLPPQHQQQYPFQQAAAASFASPYGEAPRNPAEYKSAQQPQSYGLHQPQYSYDYGTQQSQPSYGNAPDYSAYYGSSESQQGRSHSAFYDQPYQQPPSSVSNRGGASSVTSEQHSSRLGQSQQHSGEMTPATTASAGPYNPAAQPYANPYAGNGPPGPTNPGQQGGHQNYPMHAYYQHPYATYYQNMVMFLMLFPSNILVRTIRLWTAV